MTLTVCNCFKFVPTNKYRFVLFITMGGVYIMGEMKITFIYIICGEPVLSAIRFSSPSL